MSLCGRCLSLLGLLRGLSGLGLVLSHLRSRRLSLLLQVPQLGFLGRHGRLSFRHHALRLDAGTIHERVCFALRIGKHALRLFVHPCGRNARLGLHMFGDVFSRLTEAPCSSLCPGSLSFRLLPGPTGFLEGFARPRLINTRAFDDRIGTDVPPMEGASTPANAREPSLSSVLRRPVRTVDAVVAVQGLLAFPAKGRVDDRSPILLPRRDAVRHVDRRQDATPTKRRASVSQARARLLPVLRSPHAVVTTDRFYNVVPWASTMGAPPARSR